MLDSFKKDDRVYVYYDRLFGYGVYKINKDYFGTIETVETSTEEDFYGKNYEAYRYTIRLDDGRIIYTSTGHWDNSSLRPEIIKIGTLIDRLYNIKCDINNCIDDVESKF